MKNKKLHKYLSWLMVFAVLLSMGGIGNQAEVMAKSKKAAAVPSVSLKIGKEKVTKKTYKMKRGETQKINVTVSPKEGKKTIKFTTSSKKVATVNKNGGVTAKKAGTAKITVTVRLGTTEKREASAKRSAWVKIKVSNRAYSDKTEDIPATEPSGTPTPDSATQGPPVTRTPDVTELPSITDNPSPTPTGTPIVTEPPSITDNPSPTPAGTPDISEKRKNVVVYFSCTDNTRTIAEYVAESADADIYRIEPSVPYTSTDLNYNNSDSRTSQEQNNPLARPEIAGELPSLDQYEHVYLGYPIWWGQAPKIMYTFVEHYNLSGKTVIPFCTSASSGIGTSAANLQAADTSQAVWLAGRRFSGSSPKSDVVSWLAGLGL